MLGHILSTGIGYFSSLAMYLIFLLLFAPTDCFSPSIMVLKDPKRAAIFTLDDKTIFIDILSAAKIWETLKLDSAIKTLPWAASTCTSPDPGRLFCLSTGRGMWYA